MILLDISIISELLRDTPAARVVEWINDQPLETLYISATTMAELQLGMALIEDKDRRNKGLKDLEQRLPPLFIGRILPFDQSCIGAFGALVAKAIQRGTPLRESDAFVAAVAVTHGLVVASLHIDSFKALGVKSVSPLMAVKTGTAKS
ncbi:MAG: VapC toxin family PIN domain ribonuclease [Pseudomonadales bacterium]|jgi:hypothetical protein|nr:VapC toxin family PIN domain ribonuclease [Pseudomonadales bacterium]|tara:strand:- start:259 stop:702 length:444 start_codon:yes stop_codon:yes gene_type:complete